MTYTPTGCNPQQERLSRHLNGRFSDVKMYTIVYALSQLPRCGLFAASRFGARAVDEGWSENRSFRTFVISFGNISN